MLHTKKNTTFHKPKRGSDLASHSMMIEDSEHEKRQSIYNSKERIKHNILDSSFSNNFPKAKPNESIENEK